MAKGDKFYFENFIECAQLSKKAALYLVSCLENYDADKIEPMLVKMHEYENRADIKKHEMNEALAKAFVTPVDREDLDMMSQQRQCTEQEVIDIQSRKTGALIKAACLLGVLAGQGSTVQLGAAGDFAQHLGLAFQIRDDMLDLIGDAQELGKSVGVDAVKNTFVQLYGLEKCDELVRNHTALALEALTAFENTEFMFALSNELTGRTK